MKLWLCSWKNASQIASKTFAIQLFLTDHFNHKTANKTACRTPSVNPRQLWVHLFKSFRTVAIIFWGFQDFLIYLAKYFWSYLNSPNLITQLYFARAMWIKQFDFFKNLVAFFVSFYIYVFFYFSMVTEHFTRTLLFIYLEDIDGISKGFYKIFLRSWQIKIVPSFKRTCKRNTPAKYKVQAGLTEAYQQTLSNIYVFSENT